jgi:membrane-bound lytic murein transglycosylase F
MSTLSAPFHSPPLLPILFSFFSLASTWLRSFFCNACIVVLVLLVVSGCNQPLFKNDLQAIQARGVLKIITRNNGNCYYEGPHGWEGFEYKLASAFAKHIGVKLEVTVLDREAYMVEALLAGQADLIAAGFSATEDLRQHLVFGPSYHQIRQLVISRRDGPRLKSISDLVGQPLWVMAGAFHEKQLNVLKKDHPGLSWLSISDYEPEELLEMVGKGLIPITITDDATMSLNRRYYPHLKVHFAINDGQDLAWVIHPRSPYLQKEVNKWFQLPRTLSLIERLKQHYYGHLEKVDYVDITTFRRRVKKRLPKYQKHFKAAAKKYNLDWKLVAAQSYQESHWNPRARSFTGVRGMMMLTLDTARYVGIKNRLDPKQSIYGGTRFLARLYNRFEEDIADPDRTFMALAAYNVGWGHLEDARKLAVSLGKEPNSWSDIRTTLPLLRLKKYYRKLPHGYARGAEPVHYVDRIRTYYKILTRWEIDTTKSQTVKTSAISQQPL